MSDEELSGGNTWYIRLKTLEWSVYGVSVVAWMVFGAAMWTPGEYWGKSSRHSLMVGSWLLFAVLGICRLMLMRKRTEMGEAPSRSTLATLGLSETGTTSEDEMR